MLYKSFKYVLVLLVKCHQLSQKQLGLSNLGNSGRRKKLEPHSYLLTESASPKFPSLSPAVKSLASDNHVTPASQSEVTTAYFQYHFQ